MPAIRFKRVVLPEFGGPLTLAQTDKLAKKANVQGTPTILIGPTGGELQDIMPPGYAPTLQITETALDNALANA